MPSELSQAIQQVCDDKKIPLESVIATIESALAAAYRKDFGDKTQNIKVEFNIDTGGFLVFDVKEVVEDELKEIYEKLKEEKMKAAEEGIEWKSEEKELEAGEDEVKRFNPKTMISVSDAKLEKAKIDVGEELVRPLAVPGDFGRMAAQTAKQVIIQKLREAERDTIFKEFTDRQGELINGTIQRREGSVWLIELGKITAVMPVSESIRGENYASGKTFKFYVKSVEQTAKGPEVILSRANPEMLRKLFRLEVPEIASGTVQIKSIAREAGSRTKIAVAAKEDNIDPIGSCVGQRGTRVQTIIHEIGGEKIDIIEWDDDPARFIAKALSPAKVLKVETKDDRKGKKTGVEGGDGVQTPEEDNTGRAATVTVDEDQLSLAIGKEGQNVRLAAKLTGWKIDIVGLNTKGETETVAADKDAMDKNAEEIKKLETEKLADPVETTRDKETQEQGEKLEEIEDINITQDGKNKDEKKDE